MHPRGHDTVRGSNHPRLRIPPAVPKPGVIVMTAGLLRGRTVVHHGRVCRLTGGSDDASALLRPRRRRMVGSKAPSRQKA